jgi:hybrid cluster-associated redox disulfide protein
MQKKWKKNILKKSYRMKKTKAKKSGIDKSMTFSDLMEKDPEAAELLMNQGMHCCGCPMASHETIEQGALAHGLDADKLVRRLKRK